jgi:multiple sugar transport system ATP-binding protein
LSNPANTFVAGFVGSPPMSFVAARLIGDLVYLPFGLVRLPSERLARVSASGTFLAGERPADRVFVDTGKIHLFDPSTGENLARAAG